MLNVHTCSSYTDLLNTNFTYSGYLRFNKEKRLSQLEYGIHLRTQRTKSMYANLTCELIF